jgi:hypothetical protein
MRRSLFLSCILTTILVPVVAGAQSFTPNYSSNAGSGSSFQGVSFSGVGGAILNCTNIGSTISGAARDLFKSSGATDGLKAAFSVPGGSSEVQVQDNKLKKQAEKQAKKENCLDGIAYSLAKNILQQVSNKTLNWVNSGFDGNPLYVRDIDSYLKSIKDQKLESFLKQVPASNPIFGNAIRSTITQQVTGYTDGRIGQTMNTPEGRAYQAFQQDFTQGGWSALLNPNNNPIGTYFSAADSINSSIQNAQQNVQSELEQGDGFLTMKKCVEWGVQTSGAATVGGIPLDELPPGTTPSGTITPAASTSGQKCLRYENVTPGSIIAQQTAYITNSAVRQLEQADKINEVLGSFFDQLLNKLFTNGLSSTGRQRGTGVGTGMGSNVVLGTNGQPLESFASANNLLNSDMSTGGFTGDLDISRPQQLRAIIKTQLDFINRARDSRVAMNRIVPTLGALDYCFPGPNPTWGSGLSDNLQAILGSLSQPAADGPSAFQGFLNSIPIIGGLFGGGNDDPPPVLAGEPVLYDKVTDTQRKITPQTYVLDLGSVLFGGGNVSQIPPYLEGSLNALITDYTNAGFDPDTLADAYANLESTVFAQADARAFARSTYKEASRLVSYNRNIVEYDAQYAQTITDTEDAVEQLQAIHDRVQEIVRDAKTAYIAANPTVNVACLNQAYVLDTTPITPVPRIESDTPNPFVLQSIISSDYFYSRL